MFTIEYILLGITYTTLCISLFLQWVCYKRNIENIETLAFTVSLLLLVISISLSPLFPVDETTNVSTLIAMVFVSVATFFDAWSGRNHAVKMVYKKTYFSLAIIVLIGIFVGYFSRSLVSVEYSVVAFLIASVLSSIALVQFSKPLKKYEHLEKSNKLFAIIFSILVPTYLIFHFGFEKEYQHFQIGFLLYIAFALLALHKIYDDLQRLSLVNRTVEPQKQHFKNYGLTEREEEIARLLVQGITYQIISEQLFISLPTVKTHASNIYKKCHVKSRHELTFALTI